MFNVTGLIEKAFENDNVHINLNHIARDYAKSDQKLIRAPNCFNDDINVFFTLIDSFLSCKTIRSLSINLSRIIVMHWDIDRVIRRLAKLLESQKCPENTFIDLAGNDIIGFNLLTIVLALSSGRCPKGLHIHLGHNKITELGAQALAHSLISGRAPERLRLNLSGNLMSDGVISLCVALKSGACPERLYLDLRMVDLTERALCALGTSLASGRCPKYLTLVLIANRMQAIDWLIHALKSNNCPQGLTIFTACNLFNEGYIILLLLPLLMQRCTPIGFNLTFNCLRQGDADIAVHALMALAPGSFPFKTRIDLPMHPEFKRINALFIENDKVHQDKFLALATLLGPFRNGVVKYSNTVQSLSKDLLKHIASFLPGAVNVDVVAKKMESIYRNLLVTYFSKVKLKCDQEDKYKLSL
jgi:hypothetical protein